MYELSLYGLAPASQYDQLVHILSGLTCMHPRPFSKFRKLYAPSKPQSTNVRRVGGSQNIEVTKTHQQTPQSERHVQQLERQLTNSGKVGWVARIDNLPESTGRRVVTGRTVIIEAFEGSEQKYAESKGLSYEFPSPIASTYSDSAHDGFLSLVAEYSLQGSTWIHGDVILTLYHIIPGDVLSGKGSEGQPVAVDSPRLLDPSSSWLLQAHVSISDGNKPELVTKGTEQLRNFQMLLKDIVDLEMGDRLALDTRIR